MTANVLLLAFACSAATVALYLVFANRPTATGPADMTFSVTPYAADECPQRITFPHEHILDGVCVGLVAWCEDEQQWVMAARTGACSRDSRHSVAYFTRKQPRTAPLPAPSAAALRANLRVV